jgi:rhomboid protease GluP
MEKRDGSEAATAPWDAFALGALAPLGPFSLVHLAPKIPPAVLHTALRTYLSLQGDELLLALFDGGAGTPEGCCALTTRRVYWTEQDREEPTATLPSTSAAPDQVGRTLPAGVNALGERRWRYHVLRYGELPEKIKEKTSTRGAPLLDLGGRLTLALPAADPGLRQALAAYLEAMGAAARAGAAPLLSEIDPELAQRVARALPAVARITTQTRAHYRDLLEFRRILFTATPRAFVTPLLTLACVAVFLAMAATGVPMLWPSEHQLIAWGANAGVRVSLRHEYWRIFASVFVHGGLIHLALNLWCLIHIGPLVERLYGNLTFAVLFVVAGIGGAIASFGFSPVRVSVGASGAIFGVLGALLAFLLIHRHALPASLLRPLRASAIGFVVFSTLFSLVVPNIDQAAHMGGLVTGFSSGVLLCPPWAAVRDFRLALRRGAMTALIALSLAGAGWAAVRRGETTIPPVRRYSDLHEQIAPALQEFDKIYKSVPPHSTLERDRNNEPVRQARLRQINDLTERATANLARLREARTADRDAGAMIPALLRAQSRLIDWLRAARRYLESGRLDDLLGPEGTRQSQQETDRYKLEFVKQRNAYFRMHRLNERLSGPVPRPPSRGP